jgi:hypothetical protein
MFRLKSKIEIKTESGKATFYNVADLSVTTSMGTFTDTCKLTLPRIYSKHNRDEKDLVKIFKRGDEITIQLGYDETLETVFKGYLKSVSTGRPVVIECENEAWKLKQITLKPQYYAKLNIKKFVEEHKKIIEEQMPGFTTEIIDVDLGEVRINGDTSLAKVFDYFMANYPFRFFFRDGIFYGVLPSSMMLKNDVIKTHKFKFGQNIISDSLTYTLADDVKIQIVAKAILKNNKKIEYKTPEEGEIRTFLVPGATTEADLKTYAEDTLKTYKVNKMSGDFTAFGLPFVKKGDIVHLFDIDNDNKVRNEERNDKKFLVEGVTYTFGKGGYRQKIILGMQIND